VVIWRFVGRANPYQNTEDGLNRFISDCVGRLRTWPEIVVFYEMPCLRPPTGGTVTPRRPYYLDVSRGLPVVQIFMVTGLDTRMRTYLLYCMQLPTYTENENLTFIQCSACHKNFAGKYRQRILTVFRRTLHTLRAPTARFWLLQIVSAQ